MFTQMSKRGITAKREGGQGTTRDHKGLLEDPGFDLGVEGDASSACLGYCLLWFGLVWFRASGQFSSVASCFAFGSRVEVQLRTEIKSSVACVEVRMVLNRSVKIVCT